MNLQQNRIWIEDWLTGPLPSTHLAILALSSLQIKESMSKDLRFTP